MRRARLLPGFRRERIVAALERAIDRATKASFRVLHYSIQEDHLHFVIEATDRTALSRGMIGMTVRLARAFNRAVRRTGGVWGDRFHTRELKTPREVRAGIVYVLMNHKKHLASGRSTAANGRIAPLDRFSSAFWFDGFAPRAGPLVIELRDRLPTDALPVARPRTWLARTGWRRRGLVDPSERPT